MAKRSFSIPTATGSGTFFGRAWTSEVRETSLWVPARRPSLESVQTLRGFCIGIMSKPEVKRRPLCACGGYRFRAEPLSLWSKQVVGRCFDVHVGVRRASLVSSTKQPVNYYSVQWTPFKAERANW